MIHQLLENENFNVALNHINQCNTNLMRLQSVLPDNRYIRIKTLLSELRKVCIDHNDEQENSYAAIRHIEGKGRPRVIISRAQLLHFSKEGYTARQIAKILKCSTKTVYKRYYEEGMKLRQRYNQISDQNLQEHVLQLHHAFPNSGSKMMEAYLKSDGLNVQRARVRKALSEVDPIGTAARWGNTVTRRIYKVPTPNSLWHMDAHLKLVRWGFVTHGCVDGFSRMITYIMCTTSITAKTVLKIFVPAVRKFGLPSRVRSDHGFENLFVAVLMNTLRGVHRGSHITGSSVHNQRIERLWRDAHIEVLHSFYEKFTLMEEQGHLNIENPIHLYALQYIFLDLINLNLCKFQKAWNYHKIRTAGQKTPRQLWLEGMLANINSNYTASIEIFTNNITRSLERFPGNHQVIDNNGQEEIHSRLSVTLNLSEEQQQTLLGIKLGPEDPSQKYLLIVQYLTNLF